MCSSLVVLLLCMYNVYIIDLFDALPFETILLSVLYYLLMEFKCLRSGSQCPVSCTDGAIHACSLNGEPRNIVLHLIHALRNMKQLNEGLLLHNY